MPPTGAVRATIVQAYQQGAANRTGLRLVVSSMAVLPALTLVRMNDLLPIYLSLSQALADGRAPGPQTRHK